MKNSQQTNIFTYSIINTHVCIECCLIIAQQKTVSFISATIRYLTFKWSTFQPIVFEKKTDVKNKLFSIWTLQKNKDLFKPCCLTFDLVQRRREVKLALKTSSPEFVPISYCCWMFCTPSICFFIDRVSLCCHFLFVGSAAAGVECRAGCGPGGVRSCLRAAALSKHSCRFLTSPHPCRCNQISEFWSNVAFNDTKASEASSCSSPWLPLSCRHQFDDLQQQETETWFKHAD